jgi:hypothetical protein
VLGGTEAHRVQRKNGRPRIEDTNDDFLAAGRWQGRDAEVYGRPVHRDARAAVLRAQAVGDVESGDDLDAGDEGGADGPWQDPRVAEHAVDAMTDDDSCLLRLDVDVTGASAHALGEYLVDEAHNGLRVVSHRRSRSVATFAVRAEVLDVHGRGVVPCRRSAVGAVYLVESCRDARRAR